MSYIISDIKTGSIEQLRNLTPLELKQYDLFYCIEDGKEGNFKVDLTDTTSVDNLGTILVTTSGVRLKRVIKNGEVYPEWFGAKGDGTTDDTQAIQRAIRIGTKVELKRGKSYAVSAYLEVLNNGTTIFGNGATLVAKNDIANKTTWGGGHNHQVLIVSASYVTISNLTINGSNYLAGGIAGQGISNLNICNISSMNSTESQGITLTSVNTAFVKECSLNKVLHGVQLWNCNNITISDNNVDLIKMGGLWQANSTNIKYLCNTVSNCGDVGIDIEGGQNILVSGNNIQNCNNGELSIFENVVDNTKPDVNILFSNNAILRTDTYTNTEGASVATNTIGGALWISSLSIATSNNANVKVKNNVMRCVNRFALFQEQPSSYSVNTAFSFEDNQITSEGSAFFRIQGGRGFSVKGNTFISNSVNDTYENEVKNISNSDFSENTFLYKNKTSGFVISFFTDVVGIVASRFFDNNVLGTGVLNLEMKHDPYVSGVSSILKGNNFIPISTANGKPVYVDITDKSNSGADIMHISHQNGSVGFGTMTPNSNSKLDVKGRLNIGEAMNLAGLPSSIAHIGGTGVSSNIPAYFLENGTAYLGVTPLSEIGLYSDGSTIPELRINTGNRPGNIVVKSFGTGGGGDVILESGNGGFVQVKGKLKMQTGTNASIGNATLINGVVTITTTASTVNSFVFPVTKTLIGTGAYNYTYDVGTSGQVTITARQANGNVETGCNSIVTYQIIN